MGNSRSAIPGVLVLKSWAYCAGHSAAAWPSWVALAPQPSVVGCVKQEGWVDPVQCQRVGEGSGWRCLAPTLVGGVAWAALKLIHPDLIASRLDSTRPPPTTLRIAAPGAKFCLHAFPWKWLLERQMPPSGRNWGFLEEGVPRGKYLTHPILLGGAGKEEFPWEERKMRGQSPDLSHFPFFSQG